MSKKRNPYVLSGNKSFCNFCPGYCCYRLPGSSLLLTNDDINRIARYLQVSDGEVRGKYIEHRNTFRTREDGSCIFLAQGKMCKRCLIHEARPKQCREFPYDRPCPYLENEGLMEIIQPRIEESLWAPVAQVSSY
ncbi:YkgJ family cysteine cluster protein [Desulfobulbus rhabdoformis]|uniref:YkgJ family cysteine cluster protein n=1 Tax=Desulfobulbus rhabdoformis TaxID=34032 RepID=UPI001963626B|nr:YkgJ family cysteine cluster protein [Desulfobulbus rhabdoformis]MBM9614458.1 YkgJ family cysteine cluster protein [Desulfobulbus rhabdoformis]